MACWEGLYGTVCEAFFVISSSCEWVCGVNCEVWWLYLLLSISFLNWCLSLVHTTIQIPSLTLFWENEVKYPACVWENEFKRKYEIFHPKFPNRLTEYEVSSSCNYLINQLSVRLKERRRRHYKSSKMCLWTNPKKTPSKEVSSNSRDF